MNLFDIINNIYKKTKIVPEVDTGYLVVINKFLSLDKDNLLPLQRIVKYIFYIEPIHYYYLLYFNIPKKYRVPFLKQKKIEDKEDELLNKIQDVLGWSDKEIKYYIAILEATVLKDRDYWEERLGLN